MSDIDYKNLFIEALKKNVDNPKYCDVIIKRWEDYTGLKAEKI